MCVKWSERCGADGRGCIQSGVDNFYFQAEDGIRDLVRSRGLGDVYKGQFREPAPHGEGSPGGVEHCGDAWRGESGP